MEQRSYSVRRSVLAACAAVLAASLVSLVITRPLMRAVAIVVHTEQRFTWSGLGFILLLYVVALAPGAIALSIAIRWWSRLLYGAGVLLLFYAAVNIGIQETAAARDVTAPRWFFLVLVLIAMAAVYTWQCLFVWRAATCAPSSSATSRDTGS